MVNLTVSDCRYLQMSHKIRLRTEVIRERTCTIMDIYMCNIMIQQKQEFNHPITWAKQGYSRIPVPEGLLGFGDNNQKCTL